MALQIHHRSVRSAPRHWTDTARWGVPALWVMLGMGGCNSGSGSGAADSAWAAARGGALVSLTDAPGHFLRYLVTVVAVRLTRADGTVIHTVPTAIRLDLAQPVRLTDVVNPLEIPSGSYIAAVLTVDYSRASIVVDNGAGGLTVATAHVVDAASRTPLATSNAQASIAVRWAVNTPLIIQPNSAPQVELAFNLAASNSVAPAVIDATTAASRVRVAVKPGMTARLVPQSPPDWRTVESNVSAAGPDGE